MIYTELEKLLKLDLISDVQCDGLKKMMCAEEEIRRLAKTAINNLRIKNIIKD